jgi:hypothetical protein
MDMDIMRDKTKIVLLWKHKVMIFYEISSLCLINLKLVTIVEL